MAEEDHSDEDINIVDEKSDDDLETEENVQPTQKPKTPKTPKTPQRPKTPQTPKRPKSPQTPKRPKTPHTPKTPKSRPGTAGGYSVYNERCNVRLEELSKPRKWLMLATWREYRCVFDAVRMQALKERIQEEFAMSPEETEAYFNQMRAQGKLILNKKVLAEQIRREKACAKLFAYALFKRMLRKAIRYAFLHPPPPIVSPIMRELTIKILMILSDIYCVVAPQRETTDKNDLLLLRLSDWLAILLSNIYYEVNVGDARHKKYPNVHVHSEPCSSESEWTIIDEGEGEDAPGVHRANPLKIKRPVKQKMPTKQKAPKNVKGDDYKPRIDVTIEVDKGKDVAKGDKSQAKGKVDEKYQPKGEGKNSAKGAKPLGKGKEDSKAKGESGKSGATKFKHFAEIIDEGGTEFTVGEKSQVFVEITNQGGTEVTADRASDMLIEIKDEGHIDTIVGAEGGGGAGAGSASGAGTSDVGQSEAGMEITHEAGRETKFAGKSEGHIIGDITDQSGAETTFAKRPIFRMYTEDEGETEIKYAEAHIGAHPV